MVQFALSPHLEALRTSKDKERINLSDVEIEVTMPDELSPPEKVRTMLELIRQGCDVSDAACLAGIPPEKIQKIRGINQALREFIAENYLPAQIQRELVRAARVRVLKRALEKEDDRMILKAAEAIASDPDVGLKAPPQPAVNINISELSEVFERLVPLPGLESTANAASAEEKEQNEVR